jgi:predicted transcriptional regulator
MTPLDIAILERIAKSTLTAQQLGARLGRTKVTIHTMMRSLIASGHVVKIVGTVDNNENLYRATEPSSRVA